MLQEEYQMQQAWRNDGDSKLSGCSRDTCVYKYGMQSYLVMVYLSAKQLPMIGHVQSVPSYCWTRTSQNLLPQLGEAQVSSLGICNRDAYLLERSILGSDEVKVTTI